MNFNDLKIFLLIFAAYSLLFTLIFKAIYPIHYGDQELFFSEFITRSFSIPVFLKIALGFANLYLVFRIARKISGNGWLPGLIYATSPWSIYLLSVNSFYLYLLTFVLLVVLGMTEKDKPWSNLVISLASIVLLYSSLPLAIVTILFIIFSRSASKLTLLALGILVFIVMANYPGFKNIYRQEIHLFPDAGELALNDGYRGQSAHSGFSLESRIAENKYDYLFKYLALKFVRNIMPQTFFTSQVKLLNFSFTPPVYFGFILPFAIGLYSIIQDRKKRPYSILSLLLLIPAWTAKSFPDLNRLVLILPVIVFLISQGLIILYQSRRLLSKTILFITVALVMVQLMVSLFDISYREFPRYERYLSTTNFELGKQ